LWVIIVAVVTNLVTQWITSKSPDVIAKQYYISFEAASVPKKVGELVLDYDQEKPAGKLPYYLVTVQNEGNGAEENLSFQIKAIPTFPTSYYKDPDLKVFGPKEMTLADGKFSAELEKFPIDALAEVSFVPPDNVKTLCNVGITIAGKTKMGRVEGIKGVKCD